MSTPQLVARGVPINSSSLTFGFSFMGILLVMLIGASFLQRHIAVREREARRRLGIALEGFMYGVGDGEEEAPKMWDAHVLPSSDGTSHGADHSPNEKVPQKSGRMEQTTQRWKWKDVQVRP